MTRLSLLLLARSHLAQLIQNVFIRDTLSLSRRRPATGRRTYGIPPFSYNCFVYRPQSERPVLAYTQTVSFSTLLSFFYIPADPPFARSPSPPCSPLANFFLRPPTKLAGLSLNRRSKPAVSARKLSPGDLERGVLLLENIFSILTASTIPDDHASII
jgi:hypothetical protein